MGKTAKAKEKAHATAEPSEEDFSTHAASKATTQDHSQTASWPSETNANGTGVNKKNISEAKGHIRTGNYNIFNGGKIRIDLTNTKYKLIRECALEMKWKVVTAVNKKDADGDENGPSKKKKEEKVSRRDKHDEISQAE